MEYFTFEDAYVLNLIARNPTRPDWHEIKEHLKSEEAKKIASELIEPNPHASRKIKSAAEDLRKQTERASNSRSSAAK